MILIQSYFLFVLLYTTPPFALEPQTSLEGGKERLQNTVVLNQAQWTQTPSIYPLRFLKYKIEFKP